MSTDWHAVLFLSPNNTAGVENHPSKEGALKPCGSSWKRAMRSMPSNAAGLRLWMAKPYTRISSRHNQSSPLPAFR